MFSWHRNVSGPEESAAYLRMAAEADHEDAQFLLPAFTKRAGASPPTSHGGDCGIQGRSAGSEKATARLKEMKKRLAAIGRGELVV